jgi:hypothetical protein
LRITVTYRDREGVQYNHEEMVRIAVNPERSLERLFGTSTPLNINIGELYQSGARRINGDAYEGGSIRAEGDVLNGDAQKGDRVEIRRDARSSGDRGRAREASTPGSAGPKVTRRDAGPVRRCPICNVPTTDPEQRYCSDCGAPLPSPNVKEDV